MKTPLRTVAPIALGWLAKGATIASTFANMRLLVELTGLEGFAAHAIVFSLLTWLNLLNLGIPTAVQNAVVVSRESDGQAARVKADAVATVFMLGLALQPVLLAATGMVLPMLFAGFGFVGFVALWYSAVAMATAGLGLTFNQILYAEHRPLWPNVYPAFVSVGSTVGLFVLHGSGGASFDVVLGVFFTPFLLAFVVGLMLIRPLGKLSFDPARALAVIRSARGYGLFACLLALSSGVDYFVLARTAQPSEIGSYALANRLFVGILSLYAVILATRWSTMTVLMHRKSYKSAASHIKAMLIAGGAAGMGGGALLWSLIDYIAPMLSSGKIQTIPPALMAGWFGYLMARIWSDTFVSAMLASGHTGIVNRSLAVQTAIGIPLQLLLAQQIGAVGVVVGMLLGLLLTTGWILPSRYYKLTKAETIRVA